MLLKGAINYKSSSNEEVGLWENYYSNDKENLEDQKKLVELYLPLVANVAKRMSVRIRQYTETEELLSMGVVGLHKAVAGYNHESKASFKTFASKKIKGAILDDLRGQDHLTRTQRRHYKNLSKIEMELKNKLNRDPSITEIAKSANMKNKDVYRYLNIGKGHVNLETEISENKSFHDVIYDHNTLTPSETVNNILVTEELRKIFKTLPDRDQKILFLRHYQGLKLKDIADVMKLSQSRISQIYQETVVLLREKLLDEV